MRMQPITPIQTTARSAFSLLELSVVIAIMSVVAVMGLEGAATFAGRTALSTTQERIRTVDEAIAQFFRVYGRLPCPAAITRAPTNTRYGLEDCTIAGIGTTIGGGVRVGAVPFRTLNLPFQSSLDAYESKFVYAVSRNLTIAGTTSNRFGFAGGTTTQNGLGAIEVRSGQAEIIGGATVSQLLANPGSAANPGAAYLIFSPGADKRGAFSKNGTLQRSCVPTPTAAFDGRIDTQNCAYTGTGLPEVGFIATNVFYDSRYNPGTQEYNYFDDVVIWRTKGQL